MQLNTIQRKKARGGLEAAFGKEEIVEGIRLKSNILPISAGRIVWIISSTISMCCANIPKY